VRGTATAAAIWATGIVGAAVGYGRFEIALVLSAFTTGWLYFITKYEVRHGLRDPITGEATDAPVAPRSHHAPRDHK
jgi:uncharacterized membrane protein YhiD involved in acid resistance